MSRRVSSGLRGVSGRLLGAIAVPVLALAIALGASVARGHNEVREAAQVAEHVELLQQLVELRSAVFRERLAVEIFVPSRRPSAELLSTTLFGSQIAENPEQLALRTNAALLAIPGPDRPFGSADLEQARVVPFDVSLASGDVQGAFDAVDAKLSESMAASLSSVRQSAIELGDRRLTRAATAFDRSVRLPEEAGVLVASLAELWTADAAGRPLLQSHSAMALATFEDSSQRLIDVDLDPLSISSRTAAEVLEMPSALQAVTDGAMSGELTAGDRPPSEPVDVGLGLLTGVDWLVQVDSLPVLGAEAVTLASERVSADARSSEHRAAALAFLAIAGSITAAVLFGRSIVRPVRRLTDQAERIGRGYLDADPPQKGPPEIVRASQAMNDMVENLVLLEQKSQALARADFDDDALRRPLPGRLGAGLQLSMEVLSASIEQRESLQSQLEYEAAHDALTGVGNRASLTHALNQMHDDANESPSVVAVMFIDLNDFKGINDRHGHAAGDEVLRVAASRMLAAAPARALVARLGGDEFVIAMADVTDMEEPLDVARRVTQAIAVPLEVDGRTLELGASAGVAMAGPGAGIVPVDPLELLHMADLAVYSAKLDPTDNVAMYDDELDRRLAYEREIEAALAAALDSDSTELHLVFQPIVRADDESLRCVEALLRWNRPGVGPVAPDDFIPIAERSDLILDVDRWVFEAALRQLAIWQQDDSFMTLEMSINMSGRSLLDRTFVGRVTTALASSGLDPRKMSLEVTETALVSDLDLAAAQVAELRALGIRVVIDDFGTGYTSIAHLRALPVDELKIDGSFVQQLPDDQSRILIEMITQLAHPLHLPTVAEGVETQEQAEMLRNIGCDSLQGYYFSPPLGPDELVEWHQSRAAPRPVPTGGFIVSAWAVPASDS